MKRKNEKKQSSLTEKLKETLSKCEIGKKSRILVAVSGGPDSTALLLLLHEVKAEYELTLKAAYFNHGIRPEEELQREFELVKSLCSKFEIPLFSEGLESGIVEAKAREENRSLEDCAREARYIFFKKLMMNEGCHFLATGHTADDQAETMLMRILQGSGPGGLSGIPLEREETNFRIIRPIIDIRRQDLLDFLSRKNQAYAVDLSNTDTRFLRNAIRHRIVPEIESVLPGFRGSLERLACNMREMNDIIEREAYELPWQPWKEGQRIRSKDFISAPFLVKIQSLFLISDTLKSKRKRRIPARFFEPICRRKELNEGVLAEGYGIRLEGKNGYLYVVPPIVRKGKNGYLFAINSLEIGDKIRIGASHFSCIIQEALNSNADSCYEAKLQRDRIFFPLLLRSRRIGDSIRTGGGEKNLKKLFSQLKIKPQQRDIIPILEDRRGIIAVLAGRWGGKTVYSSRFDESEEKDSSVLFFRLQYNGVVCGQSGQE